MQGKLDALESYVSQLEERTQISREILTETLSVKLKYEKII